MSKEEFDGLFRLMLINLVRGYIQVPVIDFSETLSPVPSDKSTRILIEMNL